MELIKSILFTIKIILFVIIALNCFYRIIRFFYKSSKLTYSDETRHRFICHSCNKEYYLNGAELKEMKKSSVLVTKSTPRKTVKYFKTYCPLCGNKASQEKTYDINIKYGDFINLQMDRYIKQLLLELLLKGILPTYIFMSLFAIFI